MCKISLNLVIKKIKLLKKSKGGSYIRINKLDIQTAVSKKQNKNIITTITICVCIYIYMCVYIYIYMCVCVSKL